ncbi:MAG: CBS domain-containing protein [Deltaproteobacteria bacterium]|nr:CBS domain-containing protein [Deltaproteobacteria bacterium]
MLAASKLYPKASLAFPGSQEKNLRNFFLNSTFYLLNITKVKKIDIDAIKRLILVDTRQKGRIGDFARLADHKDVEIHIYDHHPAAADDIPGQLEIIRKIGSNTALMVDIIRKKRIPVSPEEATVMCLGIHEDTGSFTFSSTTSEDYDAAAWLAAQGADHNVISDMLTRELTTESLWLLNDLIQSATTRIINGTEIVITKIITDEFVPDFAVLVHRFMEMESLRVVFALAQMENRIFLVARSRVDTVDAGEIASAFGGGGHPEAASATVKDQTLIQVERTLDALLNSRIRRRKNARDMMSSPVIAIHPDDSVAKAADYMTRYNINVLMVMDEKGLSGYVTRQIVEKAAYLGLGDRKVCDYMNIEFATVHPDAPLTQIQDLIIRGRLRILPVVENRQVKGVITRTDLLNILVGNPLVPDALHDGKRGGSVLRKRNLSGMLKERLPEKVVRLLKEMGDVADELGYGIYLVGGLVRDIFLKFDNLDVDIVIEGNGIKFAREFAKSHTARVRSHQKFGTAVLVFSDGFKVDVATARIEYYKSPGAPPIVETSSLKLDLYRRDFTMNTLALSLSKRSFGTLIDYFGAQKDIKDKALRVLHNLSFVEDPTRMLRAIRFEQRFGFTIGKLTLALMKNAAKMDWADSLASRRILGELKLILKEADPISSLLRLKEFDLLKFASPALDFTDAIKSLLEEVNEVIAWYHLLFLEEPITEWKVFWYGLTSGIETATFERLSDEIGAGIISPRGQAEQQLMDDLFRFDGTDYELFAILRLHETEMLLYLMAKAKNERMKKLISHFFTQLKGKKIRLNGDDLLKMGFKSGPIFKEIFERLLEARMNQVTQKKEDERALVKKEFGHLRVSKSRGKGSNDMKGLQSLNQNRKGE